MKISYIIAIIGVLMIIPLYVGAYFDVNYETDYVDSNRILWTLHNYSFYVIIFAGIVFVIELRNNKIKNSVK